MERVSKKYALCALLCGATAGNGYAAGFQLFEQGVSGLGTAYASGAAAEDASTIFWNPAGMTYLPGRSVSAGLHLINASAKFKNNGSTFVAAPLPIPGTNGGDAGGLAPVPNLFYSHALNDRMRIGVGMSSVFGLKTEYDANWVGRYQAILSDLRTINVNPSFAMRTADDRFSFGFGLNLVRADVKLSNDVAVNLVTRAALPPNGLPDVRANLEGDDWGYGINLGGMFQASPSTRFGLSYRSKVRIKVEGDARFSPAIPVTPSPVLEQLRLALSNSDLNASVDLPGMMSFNAIHQLNDRWSLMGDVTWTNWSKFRELRINFSNGTDSVTPERWHDSLKVALGASFKQSEKLTLRAGVARDNSPVDDEFRTPRIPDGDRTWLAFGARYSFTNHNSIDVGFAHLFVKDPKLDKVSDERNPAFRTRLIGEYDSNVNILSVQYNHNF